MAGSAGAFGPWQTVWKRHRRYASIAFEITFTAAVVTLPPLQEIFGTRPPEPWQILALVPFPLIVWGTDELWRYTRRRKVQKQRSARD